MECEYKRPDTFPLGLKGIRLSIFATAPGTFEIHEAVNFLNPWLGDAGYPYERTFSATGHLLQDSHGQVLSFQESNGNQLEFVVQDEETLQWTRYLRIFLACSFLPPEAMEFRGFPPPRPGPFRLPPGFLV